MALANLNTADFIKGDNVSQDGRVITVGPVSSDRSGFTSYAYAIWSGSGLTFNVFTSSCYINGVLYPALNDSVTLDAADPTDPRLDLIIRTATTIDYITGTPATDPVKPTADNLTELEVTVVLIQAGATTPDVTEEVIYAENAEWTGSSDTTSPDFANTNDPVSGTYHVNINGFTNGQYVQFVDASTHDLTDYNYLKFYVRLKGTFATTAGFIIYFKNGSSTVTTSFTVTNGIYSFDRTDLSGYQLIAIPLNEFTITGGSTFDTVVFSLKGSNTSGFKMDNIGLQGGVVGASDLQNAIVTIITDSGTVVSDQPSDTIQILGGTNVTTSAVGKVITIDATGGGGTPSGADTYVQYNDGGSFGGEAAFTYNKTTNTLDVDNLTVDDEAYGSGWNGSLEVPTKNAVYDKIEEVGYWKTLPGTPVRSSNTVLTITDTSNANLYDLKFNRGTVLKWDDTTVHMAMVVSATYSANTVTITIIGDVLSGTATMSSFKYALEKAEKVTFGVAGTIVATTNISRKWKSDKPYRIFGADGLHGTAGTTNATTYDINKNGTTFMTTKLSIASGATAGNGYTADDNTSFALDDVMSLDCDSVSTTAPIDAYIDVFIFPTYNQYL